MPRIINTIKKITRSILKVKILVKESIIFCNRILKETQFLASLKTLKRRMLLKTKMPPPLKLLPLI